MRSPLVALLVALTATAACKDTPRSRPAAPATADPWASPDGAPAPAARRVVPMVWEARKGDAVITLLGTIHVGVDALTQLPPWVLARLDAAPAFAMEADVTDPSLVKLLVRTDGKTLADELGPTDWERLRQALGPPLADGMNGMKPFAALSALAVKDLPLTTPMDVVLHARARQAGKRLVYLETIAAQLAAVEPFATAADVKALLDHGPEAKAQTEKLLEHYRVGDADALAAMTQDQTMWVAAGRDPATFHESIDAVLGNRNRAWVQPIADLAAAGGGFVAVGAAHLAGPDNVPDLLVAAGFTVRRVTGP